MKFLAAFAALVAVAAAAPTTSWTLNDLSQAIQNPATPAAVLPYLEQALNQMMDSIFAGQAVESIVVPTPAGLLPVEAVTPAVVAPAGPTTSWTLNDLSEAIQNPATPAAVLPYLEQALNQMMDAIFAGQAVESVVVPTPVGLLPIEAISPVAVMPVEVDLTPAAPVEVAPVPAPVVPEPAVIADASGSPLVQIVVNIKSLEPVVPETVAEVPAAVPAPAAIPEPVLVVEQPSPAVVPEPIVIAPAPAPVVIPEPIVIAPAPAPVVVAPEPVVVVPEVPNPIDVIAVGAPDINPIDILQPIPVVVPGENVVGPIV